MTVLEKQKALEIALQQMMEEVKKWPDWKQRLVCNDDFRPNANADTSTKATSTVERDAAESDDATDEEKSP